MGGVEFKLIEDRIVVACQAPSAVDDRAYAPLLRELERIVELRGAVQLVLRTEDQGGPDVNQRAELNRIGGIGHVRMAFVTDSRWTRGVASAISWSGRIEVKAFGPTELAKLGRWLELDTPQLEAIRVLVGQLEPSYAIEPMTPTSAAG